jgi:predicted tellurium resistance membrane protein TerC
VKKIIKNKENRWIGEWWMGWIVIGSKMMLFYIVIEILKRRMKRKVNRGKRSMKKIERREKKRKNEEKKIKKKMM